MNAFVKRGSTTADFFRHGPRGWGGSPRRRRAPGGRGMGCRRRRGRPRTRFPVARSESALRFGRSLAAMHDAGAADGAPAEGWAERCSAPSCVPRFVGRILRRQRVRPFVRIAADLVLGGTELAVVSVLATGSPPAISTTPATSRPPPRRLWTGNVQRAPARDAVACGARGGVEAVLIDPAAHGGHRETDLAMLALFGAPHLDRILSGYQEAHPLRPGWRERVPLHQMHPLATHSAGHGAGYALALADAARAVLRL